MIAYGNVILFYKITGASGMPRPTKAYVIGTINYNFYVPPVVGCLLGRSVLK